ncbi:MAG: PQQ-binding-like beta-propeller repeat protein [Acidobacteria bacterium]|nr:PQQ-binding-like beta-propeller repeat protein [Acidobacteriota bacterium]
MLKQNVTRRSVCGLIAAVIVCASGVDAQQASHWPSFRGIRGAGVADGDPLPANWNVPQGTGVLWKMPLSGLGHSSPVVWGTRVCVTTAKSGKADAGLRLGLYGDIASVADDTVHTWWLTCLDTVSGKVLFETKMHEGKPAVKRHTKSTHANSTLATDGVHLVAMLGSEGLHAFDMNGKPLWKTDLGVLDSGYYLAPAAQWEFGSSPVIHDGKVVVQVDVQQNSFLAAFDVTTGAERWRTARADVPTWSTPTIHEVAGRTQVLVNGWRHMGAYDFETGQEIWNLKSAGGDIPVPTPVTGHGLVYLTSAHGRGAPVFAVRETATGDVTLSGDATSNEHIAWSHPRDGAYMMSPVLYRGLLYVSKNNGVFAVFDALTGERVYQQRLGDGTTGFTASLVAGDGKVYFSSEDGDVFVVQAGRDFKLLATNPLGDYAMATPAIAGGTMFFRTGSAVIAVR